MTKEKKEALDAVIVADLHNSALLHVEIAIRHKVGLNRICNLAKKYGLTRKRGPKPRNKPAGEV